MRKYLIYILLFFTSLAHGQGGILIRNFAQSDSATHFVFTIDNSLGTNDSSFTVPTINIATYDAKIKWGDGTESEITAWDDPDLTHKYNSSGEFQIRIIGKFERIHFNSGGDRLELLSIDQWGDVGFSSNQTEAFYGCSNLDTIAGDSLGMVFFNDVLTNGALAFRNASFSYLPDSMRLDALTDGFNMFNNVPISSLPDDMKLNSLIAAFQMFSLTNLSGDIPFTVQSLTDARGMLNNTNFDTLDISSFEQFQGNYDFFASNNSNLKYVELPTITGEFSNFDVRNCALSAADIIFAHFDDWYTDGGANDPTQDLTIDVSGGTNAPPTDGGSNVNIQSLSDKFTAASQVFTAIYNTP